MYMDGPMMRICRVNEPIPPIMGCAKRKASQTSKSRSESKGETIMEPKQMPNEVSLTSLHSCILCCSSSDSQSLVNDDKL